MGRPMSFVLPPIFSYTTENLVGGPSQGTTVYPSYAVRFASSGIAFRGYTPSIATLNTATAKDLL